MLPKLSVKKPMTIFVAVVIVITLGIVSFTRMTPDLLPNMDFPYAIIMTTYVGQTPETVEMTVSKPLEASLSTIDGVKEINSTSSDNYSMVIIEFEDGTNMDTATVDMRGSLDTISDNWPDGVGTPYLIKINPNMMPVSIAAVDYKGYENTELSNFVKDELLNTLEGIDGVASVSTKGIITEKENVILSQSKIDALNKKISKALNDKFADAEDKLNDAKKTIEDNINQAQEGNNTITSSIEEINKQQEQVAKQLSDAKTQAQSGYTEILNAKMKLLDQQAQLTTTKSTLEIAYNSLVEIKTKLSELSQQKEEIETSLKTFEELYEKYSEATKTINDKLASEEAVAKAFAVISKVNETLKKFGFPADELEKQITDAKTALKNIEKAFEETYAKISKAGVTEDTLDETIAKLGGQLSQINDGIAQLSTVIEGLDSNTVTVNEALSEIDKQRSSADFKMSTALTTLTVKQSELTSALTQLNSAKAETDAAYEELTTQKKSAIDAADMSKMVSMTTISGILTAQNFSMPAGYVTDDNNNKYLVRVGDKILNNEELMNLPLFDTGIDDVGTVKLSDVADVFFVNDADEVYATINGNDGVVLSFSKQSNTATSTVSKNIDKEFKNLEEKMDGLTFTKLMDQGDYIKIIINSVLQNLLLGALFAIIILFLFLRDIKPTFIVACSIPISVVFAIVLMYFSGISLNMISISGLAIGVGMLVDNSVVVIENIYRLRNLGVSSIKAAFNGAKQVSGAIAASTLTTICVFLPIVFVEGITRQLFVDMALTIAYSLLASLIIALSLVPAMAQKMLKNVKPVNHKLFDKAMVGYEKALKVALKHKVLSIVLAMVLLVASTGIAIAKGYSFMPDMSSTEISISVSLDKTATFEDTVKVAEQLSEKLLTFDEFETVGIMTGDTSSLMGLSMGGGSSDAGSINSYVVLKEEYTKDSQNISKRIEKELEDIDGNVSVSGSSSMSSMSTLMGGDSVTINIYGTELQKLQDTAKDIADKLSKLEGIDTVNNGIGTTSEEIKITIDKEKAAAKSLTVAQVFQQLAGEFTTTTTSTQLTKEDGTEIDVVIEKDKKNTIKPDTIENIKIKYTDKEGKEKTVRLNQIADVSKTESMNTIARNNQKRYISVTGALKEGYTLSVVTDNAKNLFKDYQLPTGFSMEFSGSNKTTMEAIYQLLKMMALAIILIYLIMVAQFQSLKSPFIIMFTIPLAFTGGFLGLIITGFDVSVISLLGFVMLCGIIVNNGIVLVDYVNNLRLEGMEKSEALIEAGKTRMRPILITAMTTILGLSVMALGIGTGSEIMQPLAIVCIGGLLYATLMTLFIVPVIYDLLNKKELRKVSEADLEEIEL